MTENKTSTTRKQPQAKRWCYTLNNPTQPIPWNDYTQVYHVYGEEVGESGTKHYQGFVIMKNQKRLNNMKELNSQAHWEIARGSNKEASDYCKKDGKFHEFGVLPEEPHKLGNEANSQKWREISDLAKKGDLATIDEKYPKPFISCYKNLKSIKTDFMKRKEDLDDVCGIWYYGEAGVGKTRLVTKLYPNAYLKRMNKWFDGYQHEDTVVLDDLDHTHAFMGYELKKLADRYCYMVEVKNDSLYIRPKRVIVTSQYTIDEIWKTDDKTKDALKRRFKQIEVTKNNISMLLNLQEPSSIEEIQDDSEAMLFDQLMVEAEEHRKKKSTLNHDKIKKLNEYIANKPINYDNIKPKKLRPTNTYFPDKRLKFPVPPTTKPVVNPKLERKNAMTTPPVIKPTFVPPPAPKKQKRDSRVVIISDDECEEESSLPEREPSDEEDYGSPRDTYGHPTLHDLYADEIIEDSFEEESDNFSDEY